MVGGTYCAYRGCTSKTGQNVSFFKFPKDPERSQAWLLVCDREDLLCKTETLETYRLCEKHFETKYFSEGGTRKRLFDQAIPTPFSEYINIEVEKAAQAEKTLMGAQAENIFSSYDPQPGPSCSKDETNQELIVEIADPQQDPSSVRWDIASSSRADQDLIVNVPDVTRQTGTGLLSRSSGTQTSVALSFGTPRKQKLREKVKALRKTKTRLECQKKEISWTMDDFFKMCDNFLTKPLAEIVKNQATLKDKKPLARRYSLEYKQFALTLYFLGPRAYAFIKKILFLPSKRSLQRFTEKLFCKPGLANDAIFRALEIKIKTMFPLDRHCMISIDEMSLKANLFYHTGRDEIIGLHDIGANRKDFLVAQNASVIMARGLYSNWKQPIAYFFVNSQFKAADLRPVIEECVRKLYNVGLYVDVLITDMGSNFIELAKNLNVSPETSEFEIGEYTLIYIFDPCHLLKATKNNLIANMFSFDGKKTSWTFVEAFYTMDKKQFYRCAPKLTDAHIYPSNFDKMKVKLAVQVLSHTVASGMNTYVSLGALPSEAFGTVEVIEKFNNLFDLLNSSESNNSNKYKNFFEGSDFQLQFLDEMKMFLTQLQIFNKNGQNMTSKSKFKKCWVVTIQGIKQLWRKLSGLGFKYLRTRRVNQDCLENFFGNIRQQGGNCYNPTPIQFERAFRKLFCQSYLHSNQMNCQDDMDELLTKLNTRKVNVFENPDLTVETKAISLPDYDYRSENLTTQNAFTYVCGYLIKKSLNVHSCNICINFSKQSDSMNNSQLLTYFKAYDSKRSIYGGLRTPAETFLYFIYQLEKIFVTHFDELSTRPQISHSYLNKMQLVQFLHPCSDFPLQYVIKLFIRMRIFYTLKYANRDLKVSKKSNKKHRKLCILSHI